ERSGCYSACNFGSDAILVRLRSIGADESSLKEIELPTTVHLALHELQLGDLALGLAIGPSRSDCGADSSLVIRDPVGERFDKGRPSPLEPRAKIDLGLSLDHGVELSNDLSRLREEWHAVLDSSDGDRLRFRERIAAGGHKPRYGERPKNRYARFWRAAYLRMSDELRQAAFRGEVREPFAEVGAESRV